MSIDTLSPGLPSASPTVKFIVSAAKELRLSPEAAVETAVMQAVKTESTFFNFISNSSFPHSFLRIVFIHLFKGASITALAHSEISALA